MLVAWVEVAARRRAPAPRQPRGLPAHNLAIGSSSHTHARAGLRHLARTQGNYVRANATSQQALAEPEAASNVRGQAKAQLGLCQTAHEQVDDVRARARH
jgi:hypothetical protein